MTAKMRSRGFTLIASLLLTLLLSGVAIALLMMVNTEQRVGGADLSNAYTYRAAEGGMEKMTSDLAQVFKSIQSPSNTEICNSINPPTLDTTITYPLYTVAPVPGMPTQASPCPPLPTPVPWGQIQTGPETGLYAQILPIVLNVTAQRNDNMENVSMTRTAEVVLIPVFQFGVFSDSDVFFGQSPNLGFAGRVHTNGDLYLGVANGDFLVFGDKLEAFGNVIREQMDDGMAVGGGLDDGTVLIPNSKNGCSAELTALYTGGAIAPSATCINIADNPPTGLGATNGSVVGGHGSAQVGANWVSVSTSTYNSYIIDGNGTPPPPATPTADGPDNTGAANLTLPFVQGTNSAIQIIRQPPPGELPTTLLGSSREANMAQIRVILSDTEDGLHLPGWNGNSAQDVHLVSELPTALAALNQGQDLGSPGVVQAGPVQVGQAYPPATGRYYSFGESYCTGKAVAAVSTAAAVAPATAYGALGTNTTPANYKTTFNTPADVVYGSTASGNYIASNYEAGTYACPTFTGAGTYAPGGANAGDTVNDTNFVIPPYFGGPTYSNPAANNWPPTVFPQTPQAFPPLVTGGAGGVPTFTTPNGGTNGLEWPLIGGWLLVEYQNNAGSWVGVTTEWLGLGFARGVNVPTEAGVNCGALGVTNGTNTLLAGTTGVNPNGCNYLGDHANAILYFEETKDSKLSGSPATGVDTVDQPLTANYYDAACVLGTCQSQYNWYPINFYDTREGENYDVLGGSVTQGSGTPNGIMNAVELDVGNLRQWLLGKTGVSGTNVNYTAQNGYILYFSDRRGMQFTNTAVANQSQSQWGEYGFEDTVNFANLANNLKPDGKLDPVNYNGLSPEDVNSNTVLDTYGVFGVGDAWGPQTTTDTDATAPPTPYAQTAGHRINLATFGLANRVTGARHVLKLVDGSLGNLPTMPPASLCVQSAANPTACGGFTVASENPVYIQGNYNTNCPAAGGSGCTPFNLTYDTTWNTAIVPPVEPNHAAASIIADAVTLLSNHWQDWGCQKVGGVFGAGCSAAINNTSGSLLSPLLPNAEGGGTPSRIAYTSYYRAAIAGGKTIAFNNAAGNPDAYFGSDGGVHNFLRQMEDWLNGGAGANAQQSMYYKGSMVSLYWNAYGNGTWKCCNLVYTPPDRQYVFDPLFTSPQNLPPGTPMFRNVDNLSYRQNQVARNN